MNATYYNLLRTTGKAAVTHVGLVDETGTELAGGSPAYARVAEAWVDDGDGVMRLAANRVFGIPAGKTVAGWRGYSALTGGTDYGGAVVTDVTFTEQGEYTLLASVTSVTHRAG